MNILLIGGTGILSADIKELCVEKGYNVYILNRGMNKIKNTNSKVNSIICDIRNIDKSRNILQNYHFDVVIDFISYNLSQMKNTLEIIKDKCNQYIFISSATVYSNTKKGEKITEDFAKDNTMWDYAKNKLECEAYLKTVISQTSLKFTIVRPYVTYSDARIPFAIIPHDKHWTLANRILNNQPIVLWDNGQAVCTLTYSKDFAVGIVGLCQNEKAYNEDFHITTDFSLTWKEALEYIGVALEKDVIIENIPSTFIINKMPELKGVILGDKGLNHEFDNKKIKNAVPNFNASTQFKDGIQNVIKFYKTHDFMRSIDFAWNARIDRLINDYRISSGNVAIKNFKDAYKGGEKILYLICYNNIGYKIYIVLNKVKNKIIYLLKKYKSR